MPLTDIQCKNAKGVKKAYKKSDSHGLFLHVMPNGSRYWRLSYRFLHKQKLLALGVYPEITLVDARKKRDEARELLRAGIDPALNKQQKKHFAALSAENTFEAVAKEWHENNKGRWSKNYAENTLYRLEQDIFPVIGMLSINSIAAPQLLSALTQIQKRGAI